MWPKDTDSQLDDLPEKVDWDALLPTESSDEGSAPLTDDALEGGLVRDKIDALKMIDRAMCAIYVRANRECEKYFAKYKDCLGTDYETRLRPLIRWRPGRPVEMSWVTKIISERIATNADLKKYNRKGTPEDGVLTRIVIKNNQAIRVREIFKFIPRGKSLVYPSRMFDKQPNWVGIEGRRLESVFHVFRQEIVILRDLKAKIGTLHTLDTRFFGLVIGESYKSQYKNPRDYLTDSDESVESTASESQAKTFGTEEKTLTNDSETQNDWRDNLK